MTAASEAAAVTAAPPRLLALRRFAREFARRPSAMIGLGILVAVTAVALAAPLFIHPSDLDVINAPGPSLAPPSAEFPLGTDQAGRPVEDSGRAPSEIDPSLAHRDVRQPVERPGRDRARDTQPAQALPARQKCQSLPLRA